ncbi:hypothetical protein HDU89_001540, partial [Geranomyces variabilis]
MASLTNPKMDSDSGIRYYPRLPGAAVQTILSAALHAHEAAGSTSDIQAGSTEEKAEFLAAVVGFLDQLGIHNLHV